MMKIVMRWIPSLMGSISRIRRVGRISLISLFFAFPFFASAQVSSPQNISYFQYELGPGESTDDAVVIVNNSPLAKIYTLYATDFIAGDSQGISGYSGPREGTGLSTWVRFFQDDQPRADSEVEESLAGETSMRIHDLCRTVGFGSMEKKEREQLLVKKLNRSLFPEEIRYLGELTSWCQGAESLTTTIEPFSSSRIPFLLLIPDGASWGEYRGAFMAQDELGNSEPLATLTEIIPGTPRGNIEPGKASFKYVSKNHSYRVTIPVKNIGGQTIRDTVALVVTRRFPSGLDERFEQNVDLLPGQSESAEFVWRRPRFGSFRISYTFGSRPGLSDMVSEIFVVPWLWVVIVLLIAAVGAGYFAGTHTWKRRWARTLKASWVKGVCDTSISVDQLSKLYRFPPSLLAFLNNVKPNYEFQEGDPVLLPPGYLLSARERKGLKRKI